MAASDNRTRNITGNAVGVIQAIGEVADKLAGNEKMEQETKQIVIPALFSMVKVQSTTEIGCDDKE